MLTKFRVVAAMLLLLLGSAGCGGDPQPGGAGASSSTGSNRARFTYRVDLHGVEGTMTMDVEVIGSSGVTWGPGGNPSISGVIGTGDYTIYTAGQLVSPSAHYTFRGENQFADFTERSTFERFRVRWLLTARGLRMTVNPFGQGPTTYECVLIKSELL